MKKKTIIIAVVMVVISVIILLNIRRGKPPIEVETEKVTKSNLISKVSASGTIKPKKYVNISAHIPGRIEKIYVKEGEKVSENSILMKLDSTQYEANVERDKALILSFEEDLRQTMINLEKTKNTFERYTQLHKEKLISDEQLENAKAQYEMNLAQVKSLKYKIEQARASLKSSKDNFEKTIIKSPLNGVVTSLKVEEGEVAVIGTMNNPGTVLLTIADLSEMEVEVEVDETDIVGIRAGHETEITVDALPDKKLRGFVTEIGSSAIEKGLGTSTKEAKDFKVVITLKNPPEQLKPGLSSSVDIITAIRNGVLTIPISSVVVREKKEEKKEEEGIFVIKDSQVFFQKAERGVMGEMRVEILSGLREGDTIVVGPYKSLRELKDGDRVKIKKK
ncbi:MAG: efflux RND transporter periplasmic adaptor subunit [Acidobacteriota bacterium]